jgi:hypothetical protein
MEHYEVVHHCYGMIVQCDSVGLWDHLEVFEFLNWIISSTPPSLLDFHLHASCSKLALCSSKGSIFTKLGNCSSWQTLFALVFQMCGLDLEMLEWNWNCVLESGLLPTF